MERLAPALPPPCPRCRSSRLGPFLQKAAGTLGERGQGREEPFAGCTRGRKHSIAGRAKARMPREQRRHQPHQMEPGPAEAILSSPEGTYLSHLPADAHVAKPLLHATGC